MDCYPSYAPPGPRHDFHIINQSGMFMGYPRQRLSSMPDAAYRSDGLHLASGHRTSHDSKPRLSKEQQDILENAFRQQAKPSTNTKKQYAQSLGVPLDKVNNWFQNRRAKVKQEAKKQQAADAVAHPANATLDTNQSFVEAAFFQPPDDITPRPSMLSSTMQMGESIMPNMAYHDSGLEDYTSNINYEPTLQDSAELFDSFFGLVDTTQGGFNANIDRNTLSAFSKQFSHTTGMIDAYNAQLDQEYINSGTASLLTRESTDDSSFRYSEAYTGDDHSVHTSIRGYPSSIASHQAIYPDQRNSTASWASSARDSYYRDSTHDSELRTMHMRQGSVVEGAGLMIDVTGTMSPAAIHSNGPTWNELSSYSAADLDAPSRSGSNASRLGLDDLDVHGMLRNKLGGHAISSNLAARRHRQPARIGGPEVMRTASYNGTPRAADDSDSCHVRRNKSATAAANEHLQRLVTHNNSRSPLRSAAFGGEASVADLARNSSNSSRRGMVMQTVTDCGLPSPPQPTQQHGQEDSVMSDVNLHSSVAHRAPPSAWNFGLRINSPPQTPMEQSQPVFVQNNVRQHIFSPSGPSHMWPAPYQTPVNSFQPFMTNPMACPIGFATPNGNVAMQCADSMEGVTMGSGPYLEMVQQLATPISLQVSPARSADELHIHEYTPREPVNSHVMAPKVKVNTPRTFVFNNHGPGDFSSADTFATSRTS